MRRVLLSLVWILCLATLPGRAEAADKVVDIPTRAGVTQRLLLIAPEASKAALVLFAGGHGGLQLDDAGTPRWGKNNFLVRSARLFAAQGYTVAIIDAPSDRQSPPYLGGFRQSREHAADVQAVVAWLKDETKLAVWLIGTSRGTQSVAAAAVALKAGGGPDGIVLTSTILSDRRSTPVPDMAVDTLTVPVLVVHHEQDECRQCLMREMPRLTAKLSSNARKELITFRGGDNRGDACEALAYHGFNGLETAVVSRIGEWISAR